MHPGSKIAVEILALLAWSHCWSHYGGDNALSILMLPLTLFLAPGAFLSSGVRSLEEIVLYALGVVLNSYSLGYVLWCLVFKPAGWCWKKFSKA